MHFLPHFLIGLAAFYGAIGLLVVRRAKKPTCRVCGHREYCPTRRLSQRDPSIKRCYDEDLNTK